MLRLPPERMAEALASLVGAGLLERDETGLSPHKWGERQYKSDVSTERVRRCRQRSSGVTGTVQNRTDQNRAELETAALIEVTDPAALAAWEDYGRATTGKSYPTAAGAGTIPRSGRPGIRQRCAQSQQGCGHEQAFPRYDR
jgi:hypothetical protein